ncbi:putative oligopeptide transporter [Cystobasidium minutum MCA 4210]|uniref:putative oligopeptide transporter n=1 Tax=Cystobasidium minutum MCA 4210 TaxID=1397322 RepID=UPI0034CD4F62|eukprot:jgi/Rhomi1/143835/e_gw1.4.214.1
MDSTAVGSTPGIDSGKDFQQFELEDEEDSPYPEVRASVSNIDDPEMPVLTFRALFLGFLFCVIGGGLNFFLHIRVPAPLITPLTVQILSYPCGKFLAHILPTSIYKTPRFLTHIGLPSEWSLNPGPFNIKEHAIIVLTVNVAIAPNYALAYSITLDKFYGLPKGIAFDWLCLITCNCIGFSFAGLCRRHLVWPASLIWPQNLVTCTLFNTFHAEDDDGSDGSLTRFRFFSYVCIAAAVWYIFPGFLFTGLSAFSFLCWIAPKSKIVNQLFGVTTGLGMSVITFDWSQITWISSPLIIPWWAEVNIFVGFVLLYWIVVPILYYTNTWHFAYMPISTSVNFDRWGQFYNMTRVLTAETTLDEEGYLNYSMLFMSTTYTVVYALSFTLSTAAIVHTIIYNGKDIYLKIRNVNTEMEDVHAKLMRNYPEVPDWWYWAIFLVCSCIGIATIEIYETQLPVWMFLLSILVAGAYVLPGGYIYALTAQLITVNLIAETIPGYALPGKPIANLLFKTLSIQSLQAALLFIQDLKIGHYMKIPPRVTFMVQLTGTLVAGASQLGVKRAIEILVPDVCSPQQKAGLSCAVSAVMYEASIIWGIIGPERFFGSTSPYHTLLYFTILGALLPIPIWLLQRRYPRSWIKYINIPVMLNGSTFIPPATGINYSSWFIVGFIFQFALRRFRFRWWSKFCFITAAGLEGGTILAAIILFFALQLPMGGRLQP